MQGINSSKWILQHSRSRFELPKRQDCKTATVVWAGDRPVVNIDIYVGEPSTISVFVVEPSRMNMSAAFLSRSTVEMKSEFLSMT